MWIVTTRLLGLRLRLRSRPVRLRLRINQSRLRLVRSRLDPLLDHLRLRLRLRSRHRCVRLPSVMIPVSLAGLSGHAEAQGRPSRAVRCLDGDEYRLVGLVGYVCVVLRKYCDGPRICLLLREDPGLRHSLYLQHNDMCGTPKLFIIPKTRAEEAA